MNGFDGLYGPTESRRPVAVAHTADGPFAVTSCAVCGSDEGGSVEEEEEEGEGMRRGGFPGSGGAEEVAGVVEAGCWIE